MTASVYTDRRGVDDAEAGFIDNQPGGIPDKAIAAFEQRFYNYHRERHGYGTDFGYDPDEVQPLFPALLRCRIFRNGHPQPSRLELRRCADGRPNDPNGFVDTATFTKALRDEKEFLDSRVAEIGGKNLFGDNTLDYHVGYTKGTYDNPMTSIRPSTIRRWRMWPTTTPRNRTFPQ